MDEGGGAGSKRSVAAGEREAEEGGKKRIVRMKMPSLPSSQPQDDNYEDRKGEEVKDWSDLVAKHDHASRPLYVGKNRHAFLERFSPSFGYAEDFMIDISEPVSRCKYINEYVMTQNSLHAAVSIGLDSETILKRLNELCKTKLPGNIESFIRSCTAAYGKVKMVIVDDRFYLETPRRDIFEKLSCDSIITLAKTGEEGQGLLVRKKIGSSARPQGGQVAGKGPAVVGALSSEKDSSDRGKAADAMAEDDLARLEVYKDEEEEDTGGGGAAAEQKDEVPPHWLWQIEIGREQHLEVKSLKLDLPCLEEYDFANDSPRALEIEMQPGTSLRSYQEKSLSRMFSHGRARSGFIVLPCGAGKTLVGIQAVVNIKKCAAVMCNSTMAVKQWKQQFLSATNVKESDITCFLSKSNGGDWHNKKIGNLLITTYPMITASGKRSKETLEMLKRIRERQWGIFVLDEVHLSIADTFCEVFDVINAHCRLGLTATLVREDDKIKDLKDLIGPTLYEADWQELVTRGYLARVKCVEVLCPMTPLFMAKYLSVSGAEQRKGLWIMNPSKLAAVKCLVPELEEKGHKIIVFSDDHRPVLEYSKHMDRPCMIGDDDSHTREELLAQFRDASSNVKTIFMSAVGDAAIDLPDASVIIEVSSNFGSRQQEAQRLGRVLRPKPDSNAEFNAHFYTLVSKDTQEMYYSSKRRRYLVNQGYAFKVVTCLKDEQGEDIFSGADKYHNQHEEELLWVALKRKEMKEQHEREREMAEKVAQDRPKAIRRNEIFEKRDKDLKKAKKGR